MNKQIQAIGGATTKSMTKVVLDLLAKSVDQAPLDKGGLRRSAYASVNDNVIAQGTDKGKISKTGNVPNRGVTLVEGAVGYGVIYAPRQHEMLYYRHVVGKAKYLEDPLKQNLDKYLKLIEKEFKDSLKG
jgi:hypothetical protein